MADERDNSAKATKPATPKSASIELPSRANNPVSMTAAAISPPRATTKTARIDNALAREVEMLAKKKLQDEEDKRAGVTRLTEAQKAETERRRQLQLTVILGFAIAAALAIIFFAVLEKSKSDHIAQRPAVTSGAGLGTSLLPGAANRRPLAVGYYPAVSPYSQGVVRQTFPQPYGSAPQPAIQRPAVVQPTATGQPAAVQQPPSVNGAQPDAGQAQPYYPPPPPQPYQYSPPVQQAPAPVQQPIVQQQAPVQQPIQQPVQQTAPDQGDDQAPPLPPPAGN